MQYFGVIKSMHHPEWYIWVCAFALIWLTCGFKCLFAKKQEWVGEQAKMTAIAVTSGIALFLLLMCMLSVYP